MSPFVDHLLVALAVAGAAFYFIAPLLRRRKSRKACRAGCCVAPPISLKQ